MSIPELFIRRPIATTLVMVAILVFGIVAYQSLPVSDLPTIDSPTINVTAALPGANAWYPACADRRADAAAPARHPALNRACRHSPGERDDEVRIIVAWVQAMRPEIDYLMPRRAEMSNQFFLQTKSTSVLFRRSIRSKTSEQKSN